MRQSAPTGLAFGPLSSVFDEPGLHARAQRIEVGEIDKRIRQNLAILADDPDAPGAFDDKDTPGAIIGCGHA
ncbi:MAG TPA: hypothetical protein VGA15_13975, partial [Bradyrhizobium sp.]